MVLLHGKLAVGWVRAKITKAIATINMIKPIVQDVFFLTTTPIIDIVHRTVQWILTLSKMFLALFLRLYAHHVLMTKYIYKHL